MTIENGYSDIPTYADDWNRPRSEWVRPAKGTEASRQRWYCMACGRLSSIGDKPARNPCRCADLGD